MEITKIQKDNMTHALGLNYRKQPYRNHFCTYESDSLWDDLVKKGLANLTTQKINSKTYYYYSVTKKGIMLLGFKCECDEFGCQNKFYKKHRISPMTEINACRKHYYMYR